ncbi:uncharacterized protein Triagg1_10172 [Trichoderma aggressivum f. europaeum]|uniref:Uncharacterized protein n=1 Tax=Trichoderma aggressivum f. europaeum TaxID=173218 RepID=A0AAE1I5S0_9HYPO|nr:hypothetical protein Triagg1_10172 [Trichoderma aggressivum f. europaeum]
MRFSTLFNIARLAFFAVPSAASMLEVFHGTSCEDEPNGALTQMLYASHVGYSFCSFAYSYGSSIVVRSGEEPDNPDWPYCEWKFYSDDSCQVPVATMNPEGHNCACTVLPAFRSYELDCLRLSGDRRRRVRARQRNTVPRTIDAGQGYTLKERNLTEPTMDAKNISFPPAQYWGGTCDRPVPTFRTNLSFTSASQVRNMASIMVDRFEVIEPGDPGFVGNIFHAAHQHLHPIFTQLERLWKFDRVVTASGPLHVTMEFTIISAPGYALGTVIEAINPERMPRILYVLYYTMRRHSMKAVKFRLSSINEGEATPITTMVVRVLGSVDV